MHTQSEATWNFFSLRFSGDANLNSPAGGWAYGIPKNSVTNLALGAECPTITPLLVLTTRAVTATTVEAASSKIRGIIIGSAHVGLDEQSSKKTRKKVGR